MALKLKKKIKGVYESMREFAAVALEMQELQIKIESEGIDPSAPEIREKMEELKKRLSLIEKAIEKTKGKGRTGKRRFGIKR